MSNIVVAEGVSRDGVLAAETMGQPNIVQAQGITKTFGKTRVLEEINLNVPQAMKRNAQHAVAAVQLRCARWRLLLKIREKDDTGCELPLVVKASK